MATIADVPSYDLYMWPIIERLRAHGRSLTNEEMLDDVSGYMGLGDDVRAVPHGKTAMSEVGYRLAWARTYLKKAGAIENSMRGVWRLTAIGDTLSPEAVKLVPRQVQQSYGVGLPKAVAPTASVFPAEGVSEEPVIDWPELLLRRVQALAPIQFERLCQRLLRESGFTRVEVTGKSGDGGIDGRGVLRVNLLSFQVIFQCKRWQGSVG